MKKNLLFLTIFIIFSCNRSYQINDIQKLNLKGKIYKITEFTIDNNNDTIKKTVKIFNKRGFIEKFEVYFENGISQTILYKHDKSNNLVEELHYIDSNKFFLKIIYNYSKDHIEIKSLNDKNILTAKITANLDSNKHIVSEHGWYYFDSDSVYYEASYSYKNNLLTQKDMTMSDSLLNNIRVVYQGNIKGFPEKVIIYNSKGKELDKFTYTYDFDKIGNWIKKTEFKENNKNLSYIRIYEYY